MFEDVVQKRREAVAKKSTLSPVELGAENGLGERDANALFDQVSKKITEKAEVGAIFYTIHTFFGTPERMEAFRVRIVTLIDNPHFNVIVSYNVRSQPILIITWG